MRAFKDPNGEVALVQLSPVEHALVLRALQQLDLKPYPADVLAKHFAMVNALRAPEPTLSSELILR